MPTKEKVMVGMSGGVDSTVTAILLQKQGYDVVGVTFRLWSPDVEEELPAGSCCSVDDVMDAKMVCADLGIPHYVFNYKDLFKKVVVDNFVEEYSQGRTPNPCIACNRYIKFGDFLDKAKGMGFDYIATGHYSRIMFDTNKNRWRLKQANVKNKDQSYVLYNLTQEQLAHILMPLGEYSKDEIREIAKENGFVKAGNKSDSQDICFVPDGNYAKFLEEYTGKTSLKGKFLDDRDNVLGEHKGIENYTIGQRKGLGISFGKPMFVTRIDSSNNTVSLGENEQLFATELTAKDISWIDYNSVDSPIQLSARIRYSHKPAKATIYPMDDAKARVVFDEPQRAITSGQAVVFYDSEFVAGGGIIV